MLEDFERKMDKSISIYTKTLRQYVPEGQTRNIGKSNGRVLRDSHLSQIETSRCPAPYACHSSHGMRGLYPRLKRQSINRI